MDLTAKEEEAVIVVASERGKRGDDDDDPVADPERAAFNEDAEPEELEVSDSQLLQIAQKGRRR